jgi:nicotinate-nucleotide pyrophosphorylase (carboxylating)
VRPVPAAPQVADVVALALAEDLADGPDATAAATIPEGTRFSGTVGARAAGVLAGVDAARLAFSAVDPRVDTVALRRDGDPLEPGAAVLRVSGPARGVLTAERTALNLLCHLSGVATLTAAYVAAVAGTGAVVRDTRKTLPGLRRLEKAAVRAGGGMNHRMSLGDGLLVKDNHVAAAGGVGAATRQALAAAGARLPVQIEVDSLAQLEEALEAGAHAVLLDNFSLGDMAAAVARCRALPVPVFLEASGGVTLATVGAIAATGVDAIAVGGLTHSAPALDLGLDADQPAPG